MSEERSMGIIEQEMSGMEKAMLKEDTYNSYGYDERMVDIKASGEQYIYKIPPMGIPNRSSVYNWQVCLYRETHPLERRSRKHIIIRR